MLNWSKYPNFKRSEFDSPDRPGSGDNMNEQFMQRLQIARDASAIPFKINSGYRTPEHNRAVKGVAGSSHMSGHAADISCTDDASRWIIVTALMDAGFNRIGIAKTFIHCDNDPSKNPERVWLY